MLIYNLLIFYANLLFQKRTIIYVSYIILSKTYNMAERSSIQPQVNIELFFSGKIQQHIDAITGDELAMWGIMTSRHMLEHLLFPLDFAIYPTQFTTVTPEEHLPKMNAFLHSDSGMIKNFKTPLLPPDKLMPLQSADLQEAKDTLKERVRLFLEVINHPNFTTKVHPIFGELNKEEWLLFQYKHFSHHFSQFGIVF